MMFSAFYRLSLVAVIGLASLCFSGCKAASANDLVGTENNALIIPDLIHHFEKQKIPMTNIALLRTDVVHADDGTAIKVEGKEIGIYKFNTNIRKQREKLFRIQEEGFLYMVGIKKNVLINGAFVMVGWDENPKKEELEKAFMSFK